MKTVELIYEKTCPNIQPAREQLMKAFVVAKLTPKWREWEVSQAETPEKLKHYGSPTILVDGVDVMGEPPQENAACCRVYETENGFQGVPLIERIVTALQTV